MIPSIWRISKSVLAAQRMRASVMLRSERSRQSSWLLPDLTISTAKSGKSDFVGTPGPPHWIA